MIWRVLLRTRAMAFKEVRHILRDPQVLIFAVVMPVVLILLYGYAITFDVENVPLVVIDQDQTAASHGLRDSFTVSDTFKVVAERSSPADAEPLFRRGAAKVALIIPTGFERALTGGDEAVAQLLVDGSDNSTASLALGYANAVAMASSQKSALAVLDAPPALTEGRVRTFFNPELQSAVFIVPGIIVVILVMTAVMLTSLTVAREYERGSMEQLFATPVGRLEVILGKLIPYFAISLVQVLLVLTLGVTLFDVPFRGSLIDVYLVTSVFLLAMLMQGLVISIVTRNQMVAAQLAAFSTFLPALLLSGFVFPIDSMPVPLQMLANALPAKYLVHALRAIMLRGSGLEAVAVDIAAISAFFVLMLTVASATFRRTVA